MRMLLIGDRSIQNDAVKAILTSEPDWDVKQISHNQIRKNPVDNTFILSIIDLLSSPCEPDRYVQKVSEKRLAEYLIALHAYRHDYQLKTLIEAGADYCFSMDGEPDELLKLISELVGK